jgi:hypothetical protein
MIDDVLGAIVKGYAFVAATFLIGLLASAIIRAVF